MIIGRALAEKIKRIPESEAIDLIMEMAKCDRERARFYYLQITEERVTK